MAGVYGLTPEWDDTDRLLDALAQAVRGGLQALQLRRKLATPELRLAQARALREACQRHGVTFIVNDDADLALSVGADGVHLGRDDGDAATVRRLADAGLQVGVSCYDDLDRVRAALDAGAASVAMGAVYPSPTKPAAVRVPLETIRAARACARTPVARCGRAWSPSAASRPAMPRQWPPQAPTPWRSSAASSMLMTSKPLPVPSPTPWRRASAALRSRRPARAGGAAF
ncbi:thiamine phosphate synthase [Verticiella alkaliphila]|uniref:thiamine phosphate synthase n=1 Tax=Verticiella alkaliphila TaxID=2779529 RepID=UPI00352FF8C2